MNQLLSEQHLLQAVVTSAPQILTTVLPRSRSQSLFCSYSSGAEYFYYCLLVYFSVALSVFLLSCKLSCLLSCVCCAFRYTTRWHGIAVSYDPDCTAFATDYLCLAVRLNSVKQ